MEFKENSRIILKDSIKFKTKVFNEDFKIDEIVQWVHCDVPDHFVVKDSYIINGVPCLEVKKVPIKLFC